MNPVKIKSLIRNRTQVPFFNKLNLWEIVDRAAVGVDLQMSSVLELQGLPDILMKDEAEIEGYTNLVKKLLHTVPVGTTLQFVVQMRNGDPERIEEFVDLVRRNPRLGELEGSVLEAKRKFFREKFIQKRRCFIFVTTRPRDSDIPTGSPLTLKDGFDQKLLRDFTKDSHERRLQTLNALTESVIDSLGSLRIKATRLGDQEIAEFFYRHLNPKAAAFRPCPDLRNKPWWLTTRSLLNLSASESTMSGFLKEEFHYQSLNMVLLPEIVGPVDIHRFISELWPDYDLCLTVHCVDSEVMIEKLKKSGNVSKALGFSNLGSRYEAEQKFAELDELIREIRATPQKLFTFSFSVLLRHQDRAQLEANAALATKAFQEIGSSVGIIDDLNHEDLFLAVLPNHSHLNNRKHVIHSNPLAKLVPLSGPWTGTAQPKILLENPQGEFVNMDLFDPSLPSKHSFLIGSTGSGKSFATNYLMTNFLLESDDNHIVVIDIGGSYRKLCQLFNGQYLSVDLSEAFAFNPLPIKKEVLNGTQWDDDALAYLTLILERMILDQGEALNSLGETVLEKAIKAAYQDNDKPRLKDVRRALTGFEGDAESRELANHYANNLEMWSEGRYAKIFNSARQLKVDSRLIVFDLERLENHPRLQSVYFYVIREIIGAKLRNKGLRKMIVIDEGWRFFNDEIGARLIENLYRTARKMNGMILSISQSPVDFLNTKAANAIISNTYVRYVLRLTKGHEHLPQFGFLPAEIEAIRSLASIPRKFSDVFLKFNDHSTTIRLEPSRLDYWICTTDAEDAVKEEALRRAHPDWNHGRIIRELSEQSQREAT